MSVDFNCPDCNNHIVIAGIDYNMCPICGYSAITKQTDEVTIHEEILATPDKNTIKGFLIKGIKKLGEAMSF